MAGLYQGGFEAGHKVEILNLPYPIEGWYHHIQLAIDEVPCVPFSLHCAIREKYPTTKAWEDMLARQAVALISQFGDARRPEAWAGERG